jgi:hypothetical protein
MDCGAGKNKMKKFFSNWRIVRRKPKACQKLAGGWSASGNLRFAAKNKTTLKGSQKFALSFFLHPFRVRCFSRIDPGVSLRSTPGYLLTTLRVVCWHLNQKTFLRIKTFAARGQAGRRNIFLCALTFSPLSP